MPHPSLLGQDVFVLSKLLTYGGRRPSIAQMGIDLSLSPSQVHSALKRLAVSRLLSRDDGDRPFVGAVTEFLVHGVKYVFPARRGEITRGVLTSYAAPPLNRQVEGGTDLPPVWPFPEGRSRGVSLEPLYKTVPVTAMKDRALYELLALIDAVRIGRVRERRLAERELVTRVEEGVRG